MSLSNRRNMLKFWHQLSTTYKNKQLMGLDVGDRYIGIAIDDITHTTTQPLCTIQRKTVSNTLNRLVTIPIQQVTTQIHTLIYQHNICGLIVGIPLSNKYELSTSSKVNPQSVKTIDFIKQLQHYLLHQHQCQPTVYYHNEQYTTHTAHEYMHQAGVRDNNKRVKYVDKLSAAIILQDYIDNMHVVVHSNQKQKTGTG